MITYGKYDRGIEIDINTIEMVENEDLEKIYVLLQNEFLSKFSDGYIYEFGKGWLLSPTIGENVMLDIDSNKFRDRRWFYEEAHKETKSKMLQK